MLESPPNFIERLDTLIEENLSDENFTIDTLCSKLTISYTYVYRKIKSHKGLTPSMYVRTKRLQRALQFLEHSELNIQQISYRVGFNTQAYFTRCFVHEMGCPPTEYRKKYFKNDRVALAIAG